MNIIWKYNYVSFVAGKEKIMNHIFRLLIYAQLTPLSFALAFSIYRMMIRIMKLHKRIFSLSENWLFFYYHNRKIPRRFASKNLRFDIIDYWSFENQLKREKAIKWRKKRNIYERAESLSHFAIEKRDDNALDEISIKHTARMFFHFIFFATEHFKNEKIN